MTTGQILLISLAVITVGAVVGFIVYQDNKSKKKMSDVDTLKILKSKI